MRRIEVERMAIFDLFSKRRKRLSGDVPDVYAYDKIPEPLRVQLVQIINDGIGPDDGYQGHEKRLYQQIHKALCREYGVFTLINGRAFTAWESIANYLLQTDKVEHVIDIVELCLRAIDTDVRKNLGWTYKGIRAQPDATIAEANERFKEHGIGYEYASGEMIRIDSQVLHHDVVKPALKLLSDAQFAGANDEFLKAHEHYRHGRYKECLIESLKSFESTMKSICTQKGWQYNPSDTAKTLIDTCLKNGLFPSFMQSHVGNLRAILESGAPTVRNKLGGHGQGSAVTTVTQATASFALHTTATNILFFVESAQSLR